MVERKMHEENMKYTTVTITLRLDEWLRRKHKSYVRYTYKSYEEDANYENLWTNFWRYEMAKNPIIGLMIELPKEEIHIVQVRN